MTISQFTLGGGACGLGIDSPPSDLCIKNCPSLDFWENPSPSFQPDFRYEFTAIGIVLLR